MIPFFAGLAGIHWQKIMPVTTFGRSRWLLCCIVVIFAQHVALAYNMSVPLTRQVCEALAMPQQVNGVSDALTRPDDPLMQREHCSLCNIIVQNSRRWSTSTGDLRRLCTGVPPHAQRFCMYYACKLFLLCPYFYQRDAPANRGAPCNVSQASKSARASVCRRNDLRHHRMTTPVV